MLYYPQLSSGSVCQFPLTRRTAIRTLTNDLLGGDGVRMADSGAGLVRWQLRYSNLTDGEWSSIEQLFGAAEGRLNTFTFLDPADNLLMWSEDWTKPQWTADPMLQFSGGLQDPFGGSNAMQITNASQTSQRVVQLTNAPGWFQYCYSIYLRSALPATLQLVMTTPGRDIFTAIPVGSSWRRAVTAANPAAQQTSISFGLQLSGGIRIEAFGAQVEAQPAAGPYKKTTDHNGVYSATRFDSDCLQRTTDAPNQNSCVVNLVGKPA